MTLHHLSFKQLACIKVSGAICLPVIMAGHALYSRFGLPSAILAIVLGNGFLLAVGASMALMSVQNRKTTTDNAGTYFGRFGIKAFAFALLTAKCSWFAMQLDLMAISLRALIGDKLPLAACHVSLGALLIAATTYGIKGINAFSSWILPALILTLAYAFNLTLSMEPKNLSPNAPLSYAGISIAIATAITAVIDMPTYFRHASSRFDALSAALILFLAALPCIEMLGVWLSYKNPGATVLDTLRCSGNPYWNIWVSLFLILAGFSTNNANLYSAMACLQTIYPKLSEKRKAIFLGSLATGFSSLHLLQYFAEILQLLGIVIAGMGSVILISYLFERYTKTMNRNWNLFSWGFGIIFGLLSLLKAVQLTEIPLIDAWIGACAVCCIVQALHVIERRKYHEISH